MRLVRLSASTLVNPADVSDVTLNERGVVEVRMISGAVHLAERGHREPAYQALDRIARAIEAAADG